MTRRRRMKTGMSARKRVMSESLIQNHWKGVTRPDGANRFGRLGIKFDRQGAICYTAGRDNSIRMAVA
jgi:hypothetical protein